MRNGNKKIYHLEAWVVKVMSLYKVRPPNPRIEIVSSPCASLFLISNSSTI